MFKSLELSLSVVKNSFVMMRQYPVLLLPIFLIWIYSAFLTIYFQFYFNSDLYTLNEILVIVFLVLLGMCLLLSLAASLLFEFIQHLEEGKKPGFLRALKDTFIHNFPRMLPIIFLWTIIIFVLTIIQAIFSRENNSDNNADNELNARNAAYALGTSESAFSWTNLGISLFKKILRMAVFMILPAICWEEKTPWAGLKRGLSITRQHAGKFAGGFMMTELVGFFVFLPVILIFYVDSKLKIDIPDMLWFATILYMGIASSYIIFLELLFCAELYLWHLRWEQAVKKSAHENRPPPESIDDVPRPHLISEINYQHQ